MPATEQLIPRMYFKFDGQDASEEVTDSIISAEVDQSLHLPDMFAIHLRDPKLKWIDSGAFSLGKPVEVSAKNGGAELRLISGEVTAIEPRFNTSTGPTLLVRGYDRSHRLNRGRQTRSFVQMTDSDIATKIAKEAGFKTKIDSSPWVHDYVLQENQTNWEFLVQRAQTIGYRVLVKENTLYFVKAPEEAATPVLEWAVDLIEFNGRMSGALQVSEVRVQGWDPVGQQPIVGQATQPQGIPRIGEQRQGGQAAEDAFGSPAKEIIVDRPVATQAEADALAQSLCNQISLGFVGAECVCLGNPAVQAGADVELKGIGDTFSGTYRVNRALHRYDRSGYVTEFNVGGLGAGTIAELLMPNSNKANIGGSTTAVVTKNGPMIGIVTNNKDPEELGRVKVKIPSLKDNEETYWARLVTPGAGERRGFHWLPEIGDEVLLVFEHNDIHRPLLVGGLWSAKRPPPGESGDLVDSQGKVAQRGCRSANGMVLAVRDKPDDLWMAMMNPKATIYIAVQDTRNAAQIVSAGNVEVAADASVLVEASDFEVTADGSARIEGKAKVILQGPSIDLVENATHPLVFGDQLTQYLSQLVTMYQSHTHPGQMAGPVTVTPAPPVPPLPAPPPTLLSMKVKSG